MLQGISSCIGNCRVRGRQSAWRYRFQVYDLHSRNFITAATGATGGGGGEESSVSRTAVEKTLVAPLVDQSFTATHYVPDGRRFEFATVFVKAMNKGRSPLSVWQHACSLIGSRSPPTFAVAFVSKPTESAKQAIQEFSKQLAHGNKQASDPGVKSDFKYWPLGTGLGESSSVSDDTFQGLSSSEIRASGSADASGEGSNAQDSDISPIIACIMDEMGDFESSEPGQNENSFNQTQIGVTCKASIAGTRCDRASAFHRTLFDDDEEDEATLSDWEGICTEYIEEAARGNVKMSGKDFEGHEDEDPLAVCSTLTYKEDVSKEGLVSFLNALTKPPEGFLAGTGIRDDVHSLESGDNKTVMQNRKMDEGTLPHTMLVSNIGHQLLTVGNSRDERLVLGEVTSADHWLRRDGGEASPVEIWTGGGKPSGKQSSSEHLDDNYKLVLCVGHMPGAKAVAFHSPTTGLPRLPDLEKAVTVNNPHMLLLGAPGFVFPDFIQRLSSVFPLSCRAGAFLAPLYTSEKGQWTKVAEKTFSPLFFGSKVSTTGVVGLAISAKGKGKVPADAFAELVRMSVAMPRIPGFVFLDEPTSARLFLPKNVAAQHLSLPSGSTLPGQSTAILDRLSKQLLRENTVPAVATASGKVSYSDKEASEVVGVSEDSMVHSSDSGERPRTSDKLPLALFDAVLFPGWSLPFYIFEPCYRAMVRHCVEEGKPFGLSAMYNASWTTDADQSGEVIGTVANLKVHAFQKDCRSYIIAHGLRRFRVPNGRIWAEPGSFGLTVGEVQFFDDEECKNNDEKEELADLSKRALALCLEVIPEGVTVPGLAKSGHDPVVTSFAIGQVMDVPTRVKRRWLRLVDTKTRLLEQIAFLETKASSVTCQ